MSQAANPTQESTQEDTRKASKTAQTPRNPAASVLLPALFFLLLAAGALFGGWLWQQLSQLAAQESLKTAQLEQIQSQLKQSHMELKALQERLAVLPDTRSQLDTQQNLIKQLTKSQSVLESRLQAKQQQLSEHLATMRDQHGWQLSEALYQMRLASLRLEVVQDSKSAQLLLKNADELLTQQQDPATFSTRKLLAKTLRELDKLAQFDRNALYLKLAALRTEAAELTLSAPSFTQTNSVLQEDDNPSYWHKWREALANYARIDFEASEQRIRPLLAGQSLSQARLAMVLALEQAQWAVLHGQQTAYNQALDQADEVLIQVFNPQDSATQSLQNALNKLRNLEIAPAMPDLSALLASMQGYIRQRQQSENQTLEAAETSETLENAQ